MTSLRNMRGVQQCALLTTALVGLSSLFLLLLISLQSSSSPMEMVQPSEASQLFTSTAKPIQPSSKQRVTYARDVYQAGFSRAHSELCSSQTRLLILVTSVPRHVEERASVRLTWGGYGKRDDVTIAFVLGKPTSDLRQLVLAEDLRYGDMVRTKFYDSYNNLTLKTLSMLEWVATYCPQAQFILKTDDDMFINVELILRFLERSEQMKAKKTIWGKVERQLKPIRDPTSKYYVSLEEYPGEFYIPFATGPAYLMTSDSVVPLLKEALNSPFMKLEDVFLTGVVAERVGISRIQVNEFLNKEVNASCQVNRVFSVHGMSYPQKLNLWQALKTKNDCPDSV